MQRRPDQAGAASYSCATGSPIECPLRNLASGEKAFVIPSNTVPTLNFEQTTGLILKELGRTLAEIDPAEASASSDTLLRAKRVFATGSGRSGLAIRMAAMRLMHLGLTVHVAGEVTTPALAKDDVLLIASGSGTTASAVAAAETARKVGARVLVLTATRHSRLAELADAVLLLPAATKQDHNGTVSQQYAGALFEQSVLLVMDALFQQMWQARGETAEQLWTRHANLE